MAPYRVIGLIGQKYLRWHIDATYIYIFFPLNYVETMKHFYNNEIFSFFMLFP